MDATITATHYEALAETLWEERQLSELLLFRLVSARLILAADERRYVSLALSEIEDVVDRIRAAEERRQEAVRGIAASLGVAAAELRLRRLAEVSPEPWRTAFADHRDHFLRISNEIESTARDNRRLASAALAHVQGAIAQIAGPAALETYTPDGHRASRPALAGRLDESL